MNVVYNSFLEKLITQQLNLTTATLKVGLFPDTYIADRDLHQNWSDISSQEITGVAYVAGGNALTGVSLVRRDVSDTMVVLGNDVTWPASTITARYAVIYNGTGVAGTSTLITCFDMLTNKVSINGNFALEWSTDGIFTLSQAV